ncbi:hypothetical protein ACNQF7_00790 [Flavobacterium sp. RSP29]|uniref:hypothetical protein n=1 Tax=Flavobacterium sp. RSP29 TaxID=3401731 RepID=UPI003AB05DEE
MKKIVLLFMFIAGMSMISKGIYGFFPFEILPISENNFSYDLGHNIGYVVGNLGRIALGILLIKYGYQAFLEEKISTE